MLTRHGQVNLCFVTGQLLGNAVTKGTSEMKNHWAYSIPFVLQWFWCLVILPGIIFIPESPWWLVRQKRLEDAEKVLRRLASKKVNVAATLAEIVETDRLEQELEAGSTYRDVFRGVNWRRTEIAIGVYCTQVLSGIYLINYGTYFFQLAGLPTDKAFDMGVGFLGKLSFSLVEVIHMDTISNATSGVKPWVGLVPSALGSSWSKSAADRSSSLELPSSPS